MTHFLFFNGWHLGKQHAKWNLGAYIKLCPIKYKGDAITKGNQSTKSSEGHSIVRLNSESH